MADAHPIVADNARGIYPRLTCRGPNCGEASVVRQPHMTDLQWERAQNEFLDTHPEDTERSAG
jgi:hypothetical protein